MAGQSEEQSALLVFPVISDVHIGRSGNKDLNKFAAALDQLNKLAARQDAIAVVGDLTNYGTSKEYKRFFDLFNRKKQAHADALFAMGNHEHLSCLTPGKAQSRFLAHTGLSSIYYHRVIKGYHFIILGPENRTKHGYYSIEQIVWLNERLKEAADHAPGKPIFVFMHHPLQNTVYGSEHWGLEKNAAMMYSTLQHYPQVILFSGHSHYPLEDPRSIHRKDFTSVGTSSVSYMELEKGKQQGHLPDGFHEVSQGLLVEVYPHEVVIKRRSFQHDEWVGSPWVIPTVRSDNTLLQPCKEAENNLSFASAAVISIQKNNTTTSRLAVQFSQACGSAHSYRITAVEKRTRTVCAAVLAFSEFYRRPTPDALVVSLKRLKPETEYEIQVTAIDSFGKESHNFLGITGKTKGKFNLVRLMRTLLLRRKETAGI